MSCKRSVGIIRSMKQCTYHKTRIIVVSLLVLSTSYKIPLSAANMQFNAVPFYQISKGVSSLTTADFNWDGIDDILLPGSDGAVFPLFQKPVLKTSHFPWYLLIPVFATQQ